MRLALAAEMQQRNRAQRLRVEIVGVSAKAARDVVECARPVGFTRIEFGEGVISGRAPRSIPRGFVEGAIGFVEAPLMAQGQAELIVGLAVVGVGVAMGQASDRAAEELLGLRELPALEVPRAKRCIAACVAGIAAESFAPIDLRAAGGVTILLEMQASQIELVVAGDFFGSGRLGRGFRCGGRSNFGRGVSQNSDAVLFKGDGEVAVAGD